MIGSSAGKYVRFSSNRSTAEETHRSPNQVRGRTPCAWSSGGRVSVDCWNSGGRDSRHSSLPNRNGELAPTAICAAEIACAAFHTSGNRSGVTCRCSCTEVQAASGVMERAVVVSFSTPSISSEKSSPRAETIWSLSNV